MKKIILNVFLFIVFLFISLILILSTIGIETNKFNSLIQNKVSQTRNINLELNKIRFKINPKELSIFLETLSPKITYKELNIPVKNIKVYVDFKSSIKSNFKIKKTSLILEEMDINQLNEISSIIKPSNLKSLINNKIKEAKFISEIDIFLTDQGKLEDFIAKGTIKNLNIEILSDLIFSNGSLSFFADKNDILVKNIFGDLGKIKIFNGDIKLNIENDIKLKSNFNSKLDLDEYFFNQSKDFFNKYNFVNIVQNLKADLNSTISINFDDTYKIKDYNYNLSGIIEKGELQLTNSIKTNFIPEIKKISFSDLKVSSNFNAKSYNYSLNGKYSINKKDFLKVNLENDIYQDLINLKLDLDYKDKLFLNLINYKKDKSSTANFTLDLKKNKNEIKINKINFRDKKDSISIEGLVFKKNKFFTFKEMKILTANNDFIVRNKKKISIKGKKFDATNLAKFFSSKNNENSFKNITDKIEIDFKNIKIPFSENLQNFKLLGEIKKGKFVKISSKGDFGGNNYLDISMKKDKEGNKKYLEIYSDLTRPLLTEYSFFEGLTGGKLLFTSIIEDSKSKSNLKIENFNVINAPGVVTLLSLADLRGLADLAEGDGISFDILEISMEKSNGFLKINEILALGPSMSVLMEGYQDKSGLTSLRGTLVPAKSLNKIISKIPIIGKIVIPKEVGEGLFGISFKMKGSKGKIKTTINPIKTLTPRFIQKIIERNNKIK